MIYITGDTHGDFHRVVRFCEVTRTKRSDILIILGDAGINFSGSAAEERRKDVLAKLPVTLFAIHGNHERRPSTIPAYKEYLWHGGTVYAEPERPNIVFAKDGEFYDLDGRSAVALGGAYSVDKYYRLIYGYPWFEDEQPSAEIKAYAERKLEEHGWKADIVLSHTTPLKFEPTEVFMSGLDQSTVDTSTEEWLDTIEERLDYRRWYAGHFHTNKHDGKLTILFEDFEVLTEGEEEQQKREDE